MRDIFNKLGESLKYTLKEATTQTQKTVDQTVQRKDLLKAKSDLKKLYEELGEKAYEAYRQGQQEAVDPVLCDQITKTLQTIEQLNASIENIVREQKDSFNSFKREVKTAWNDNMAQQARPDVNDEGVEEMKFCPACNAGNNVHAEYCISCGAKL